MHAFQVLNVFNNASFFDVTLYTCTNMLCAYEFPLDARLSTLWTRSVST